MDKQASSDETQRIQDQNASDPIEELIQLGMRALQAATNMQWDEAQKLSKLAQAKAEALGGQKGEFVRGATGTMITIVEGVVLQLRDADPGRFQRAIDRLQEGRDCLQELRSSFPNETANAGFESALAAVELQAIWAARGMARAQGDLRQVQILDAQLEALINGMPEGLKSQMLGMLALLRYSKIMGRIKEITAALNTMDLATALRIITEVREEGSAALTVIRQSIGTGVVFQKGEQAMSGAYEYIEAMEGYVRALHDAIVGDVTRAHINQLTRAEDLIRSGAKKVGEGMVIYSEFSAQDAEDLQTSSENPITLVRNLRALCEKSLKPKRWIASASFKFVFVFLVTAIVFAFFAATNADAGLSDRILAGYVLLVSFVVALIGGFGFEALRFLPIITLLSKWRPAVQRPSGETADS
jgi:hypothetical protein